MDDTGRKISLVRPARGKSFAVQRLKTFVTLRKGLVVPARQGKHDGDSEGRQRVNSTYTPDISLRKQDLEFRQ